MTTIFLPISRLTADFDCFLCRVQPGPQRFLYRLLVLFLTAPSWPWF